MDSEDLLSGFEVQIREPHWFSRSYGIDRGFWNWTPATIIMVSGRFQISDQTSIWQISPSHIELRGFTNLLVYGVVENEKRSLIVKFANFDDSSKFAASVPGLRWTFWDPAGRLDAIPIKNKIYHRTINWAIFGIADAAIIGLFLWITFNRVLEGIFGILLTPFLLFPLHLLPLPFNRNRKKQGKGYVLSEAGKIVVTTGNIVWFDPELSDRRTRNPKGLLVKTRKKTLLLEFADLNDVANGRRLLQKNPKEPQGPFDLAQVA